MRPRYLSDWVQRRREVRNDANRLRQAIVDIASDMRAIRDSNAAIRAQGDASAKRMADVLSDVAGGSVIRTEARDDV